MAAPISLCLQFFCFALAIIGTRAQGGSWEVIMPNAGIAAMHAAVTRYNTVVLLDRTDIGPSNITLPNGEYRNDTNDLGPQPDYTAHSVLLDLNSNTVRPLMIQTDTWCSSGQFLPNGTLLQSGGWNDGSNKFRMFTPCKPDSLCDWYELPNINLSEWRWYATNQILPDGSIIIVGGIGGSTLEYYPPRPGGGTVNFPFLANVGDHQGDNLYPYVHLLPQGNLFIFANNQSVLYDYNSNVILKTFAQLEGGPRNYPSAGSSAMLALEKNYSTATIVICGGAQYDAFLNNNVNLSAKGSCGRIVATDPDPYWEMDTMPIVRIMGEMVMLPTGDVLIISGAQAGSQGFGLATDPAFNPVLYQSNQPLGSRFTTLNPTTIPRLYHSTANLLPDGRILLAGSNSHWAYTWVQPFPTELRIEAFSPDYLSATNLNFRPVLVGPPETVSYGKMFELLVTVPSLGTIVEVNIASAPFSTHSFSQGQRLVKLITNIVILEDKQLRIRCRAPPNGMVAPPGYYMMFVVIKGVPSVASWVQLIS